MPTLSYWLVYRRPGDPHDIHKAYGHRLRDCVTMEADAMKQQHPGTATRVGMFDFDVYYNELLDVSGMPALQEGDPRPLAPTQCPRCLELMPG